MELISDTNICTCGHTEDRHEVVEGSFVRYTLCENRLVCGCLPSKELLPKPTPCQSSQVWRGAGKTIKTLGSVVCYFFAAIMFFTGFMLLLSTGIGLVTAVFSVFFRPRT